MSDHRLAFAAALALLAAPAVRADDPAAPRWLTLHTDRNPAVSPDGRTLLFVSDRDGEAGLFMRPLPDGPVRRLPIDDAPGYPAWSPDGARIVYTAQVDGQDDLFVANADGSDPRVLVTHPARDGHPRFTPDGTRVVFNSERAAAEPGRAPVTAPAGEDRVDIYSVALDGSDLRRHTDCGSECSYPSLSPDGTRLLYRRVFWRDGGDGGAPVRDSEIVHAALDGSDERVVAASTAYDVYPIWTADGRAVLFGSTRESPAGQLHLWSAPRDGGAPLRVTSGDGWSYRQAVPTPSGRHAVAFAYRRLGDAEVGFIAEVPLPSP